MNKLSDTDYYRARLNAERKAIETATCEESRSAHRMLADCYQQRLAVVATLRQFGR